MRHPAEVLVSCCGDEVPIDAGLVGIVTALWASGAHTTGCCQDQDDNGTNATITFRGLDDADRFIALVRRGSHDVHAGKRYHPSHERFLQWQWWFGRAHDGFDEDPDEDHPLSRAPVLVFIPRGELGEVERYVMAARAAQNSQKR